MSATPITGVIGAAAVQAARPDLKLAVPVIPPGHPNEARYVQAVNAALSAPTIAMQNEAVILANAIGTNLNWKPL